MSRPDDEAPVDLVALRADDELIEDLIAGRTPTGQAGRGLREFIDYARGPGGPSNEQVVEAFQQECARLVARQRWTRISWAIAALVLVLGAVAFLGDLPAGAEWSLLAVNMMLIAGQQIGWHVVERRERSR